MPLPLLLGSSVSYQVCPSAWVLASPKGLAVWSWPFCEWNLSPRHLSCDLNNQLEGFDDFNTYYTHHIRMQCKFSGLGLGFDQVRIICFTTFTHLRHLVLELEQQGSWRWSFGWISWFKTGWTQLWNLLQGLVDSQSWAKQWLGLLYAWPKENHRSLLADICWSYDFMISHSPAKLVFFPLSWAWAH